MKNLMSLPEIKGPTKILVALDYYDGPISGFVDISSELYYFDLCMEALDDVETANGPYIFPISDWQKVQLPSTDYVEKILAQHDESMPKIKDLPIIG